MIYLIYLIFGLAPSLIWLLFFLRKDVHPESNRMILKIFCYGMAVTIPVALIELGFFQEIANLTQLISKWGTHLPTILIQAVYFFVGIALVEESFKYWVVRSKALRDPEFDEPLDAMLYMIIAGLGFAGLENILYFLPFGPAQTLQISAIRFVGATFLHALCSGTIGYFLALSFFEPSKRFKLIFTGLGIGALLHGLYDFSIMGIEKLSIVIPVGILIGLALFVWWGLERLKKLKSICKIT